ncbi:histidine phosphatase family protein [Actinotalea caeni]|uniref:histidine phosphatase family protein n=1 Tax=Actinotalea caeni TaxID=1348467 RepID=UPI0012E1D7ED|nr:histidine phosphatase family protein [Actinotalea caeni]
MPRTRVHLVRHGEVHNPEGILYGRLDGYRLSERGRAMAQRLAEHFTGPGFDVVHLVASPLQRAQETIEPLSRALDIPVRTDERVIEADSVFEGLDLAPNPRQLAHPRHWKHLLNPFVPSWGEPYREQVARMTDAIRVARAAAEGHDAVIVSHQSPIWMTRLALEGRGVLHDPRRRQCTLASVTTLTFDGATLVGLDYSEPAADLLVGAVAIT